MGANRIEYETSPKYLSPIGAYHYRQTVADLKDAGLYNPMDKGMIEMLARLYQETRDESASKKDLRESIKLYFQLKKDFGGTPASRQNLKVKSEAVDDEADLKEFVKD